MRKEIVGRLELARKPREGSEARGRRCRASAACGKGSARAGNAPTGRARPHVSRTRSRRVAESLRKHPDGLHRAPEAASSSSSTIAFRCVEDRQAASTGAPARCWRSDRCCWKARRCASPGRTSSAARSAIATPCCTITTTATRYIPLAHLDPKQADVHHHEHDARRSWRCSGSSGASPRPIRATS